MVHTSDIPDGAPGVVDFDMAAVQYPDDAVLTTENDQKVPNEILLKLVDYLDPKTMKCARLVCKAWKDFATPHLFRTAVFSPEPLNLSNLHKLARSDLAQHVETLFLDCTSNGSPATLMSAERYAESAATYFANVFAIGEQLSGPLCANNLLETLRADISRSMGPKYLSGLARGQFVAGFALHNARGSYLMRHFQDGKAYSVLDSFVAKFTNLQHVSTLSFWSTVQAPYQQAFQEYLASSLSQKSLSLVAGISVPAKKVPKEQMDKITARARAFDAPGAAARALNPMILPPGLATTIHDFVSHELIHAALRALQHNKKRLVSLSLPGHNELGRFTEQRRHFGMVPLVTLCEGNKVSPGSAHNHNVLMPLFRHLKVLVLNIDFTHLGNQLRRLHDNAPASHLRDALQSMKNLESLSLGAVDGQLCHLAVMNISALLLYKQEDWPDSDEEDNDDDDDQEFPPDDMNVNQMLNMMFGPVAAASTAATNAGSATPDATATVSSSSATNTTAPTSSNAPNAPAASSATNAPTTPSSTITGGFAAAVAPTSTAAGGILGIPLGTTTQPPTGSALSSLAFGTAAGNSVIHQIGATMGPNGVDYNGPFPFGSLFGTPHQHNHTCCKETPATAMDPNPWPLLKHLSLWNLPSSKEQIERLVSTVEKSLKTLKLRKIHFKIHDGSHTNAEDGLFPVLGHPPFSESANEASEPDESDDDNDDNLPALVGISAPATDPPSVPVGVQPTFSFGTPPVAPTPTPLASADKEIATAWLSTIELLADQLRGLDVCTTKLHPTEEVSLRNMLVKDVREVWKFDSIGGEIGQYVLSEESGMGFPLYLQNKLSAMTVAGGKPAEMEMARVEEEGDDASEADDDESNDGEDEWKEAEEEIKLEESKGPLANVHMCSRWQACPS